MNTLNIIWATVAAAALVALAWMSGYEIGNKAGKARGVALGDKRVRGVLDYENQRKPKSQRAKRKRARKAARIAVGGVGMVTLLGGLQ